MTRSILGVTMLLTAIAAMAEPPPTRQFPSVVVSCFPGGTNSSSWCSAVATNARLSHSISCGPPDAPYEIAWTFLGVQDEKDRYRFTCSHPAKNAAPTVVTNIVLFTGKTLTLFEDENKTVLLELFPGAPKPVPYVGDPWLKPDTNITVTCRAKAYVSDGEQIPAESLVSAEPAKLQDLSQRTEGLVLEIIEPAALRGQTVGLHVDPPFFSANTLARYAPGKVYQITVGSKEIENGGFQHCADAISKKEVDLPKDGK